MALERNSDDPLAEQCSRGLAAGALNGIQTSSSLRQLSQIEHASLDLARDTLTNYIAEHLQRLFDKDCYLVTEDAGD